MCEHQYKSVVTNGNHIIYKCIYCGKQLISKKNQIIHPDYGNEYYPYEKMDRDIGYLSSLL